MGLLLTSKRGILVFAGITALALIGTNTIHTHVHEALGHGLFALMLGGYFDGFYVSSFSVSQAIGYTFFQPKLDAITSLAGTAVSSAAGFGIVYLLYPRVRSFQWRYTALIAAAAFQWDWIYAFFSLLSGWGDMHSVVSKLQVESAPFAALMVPVIIAVYYPIGSRLLQVVQPYYRFSASGFASNFKILIFCIVLPSVIYVSIVEAYSPTLSALYDTPVEIFPGGITLAMSLIFLPITVVAWKKRQTGKGDDSQEIFEPRKMRGVAIISVVVIAANFAVMGPIYYMAWGVMLDEHPLYYNVAVKLRTDSADVKIKAIPGWGNSDLWLSGSKIQRYDHYVKAALEVSGKMFSESGEPLVEVIRTYTEDGYLVHTGNIYPRPLRVIELKVTGIPFGDRVTIDSRGFDGSELGMISSGNQLQLFSIAAVGRQIADVFPLDGQVTGYECNKEDCEDVSPLSYVLEDGSFYWTRQHDKYVVTFGR